jgi:hypothetical protein
VDSTQHLDPPDPPQAIGVSSGSDHIHVTLTDNSSRTRALHYFVEWSANDPSFLQPNIEHLGVSRQRVLALPAMDEHAAQISYYVRAYSGYPGSATSSAKQTLGGAATPTAIKLTGTSTLALLPSTGSGTASSTGMEPGGGYGTAQYSQIRPNAPKQP